MVKKKRSVKKSSEDAVRDKRHENLTPFKPGESGNPAGKKKGTKNYKTLIRDMLEIDASDHIETEDREKIEAMAKVLGKHFSMRQLMVFKQYQKAIKGDTSAFNALVDREEGRPVQVNKNENVEMSYEDYLKELPDEE